MKYLKHFEMHTDVSAKHQFILEDIFNELILWDGSGISVEDMMPRFPGIDWIDYIKEILMNRKVTFKSVNKAENNPLVTGIVTDVDFFEYKPTEIYVKVKLKDVEDEVLVNSSFPLFVFNYEPGPLQQKLEMLKNAGKFGI